jgi:hypothetical protein
MAGSASGLRLTSRRVAQLASRMLACRSARAGAPPGLAGSRSWKSPGARSPSTSCRSTPSAAGRSHSLPSRFHRGTSSSHSTSRPPCAAQHLGAPEREGPPAGRPGVEPARRAGARGGLGARGAEDARGLARVRLVEEDEVGPGTAARRPGGCRAREGEGPDGQEGQHQEERAPPPRAAGEGWEEGLCDQPGSRGVKASQLAHPTRPPPRRGLRGRCRSSLRPLAWAGGVRR